MDGLSLYYFKDSVLHAVRQNLGGSTREFLVLWLGFKHGGLSRTERRRMEGWSDR